MHSTRGNDTAITITCRPADGSKASDPEQREKDSRYAYHTLEWLARELLRTGRAVLKRKQLQIVEKRRTRKGLHKND